MCPNGSSTGATVILMDIGFSKELRPDLDSLGIVPSNRSTAWTSACLRICSSQCNRNRQFPFLMSYEVVSASGWMVGWLGGDWWCRGLIEWWSMWKQGYLSVNANGDLLQANHWVRRHAEDVILQRPTVRIQCRSALCPRVQFKNNNQAMRCRNGR